MNHAEHISVAARFPYSRFNGLSEMDFVKGRVTNTERILEIWPVPYWLP